MELVRIISPFFLIWFVLFFMILPFGVRMEEEIPQGHASSAPKKTHLLKKSLWTSLLSAVLTALWWWYLQGNYMKF